MQRYVIVVSSLLILLLAIILAYHFLAHDEALPPPSLSSTITDPTLRPNIASCAQATSDEFAIFSATSQYLYLKSLWNLGKHDKDVPIVVILAYTRDMPSPKVGDITKIVSEEALPISIADSYSKNNNYSLPLLHNLSISKNCYFMGNKEYQRFFSPGLDGWRAFSNKYPNTAGILSFSRPGISNKAAIIYGQISCGSLCGLGMYLVLTKNSNSWCVVKEIPLWVS